jgi:hypothetical protein
MIETRILCEIYYVKFDFLIRLLDVLI